MFARLIQSQAISQSFSRFHHFQIKERYEQVSLFFHISKLFFIQNYRFLYHGDQKISCGESVGGGQSTSKSTCEFRPAFGDRPASSSMSKFSASVNSDLGNGSFWVEIRDAEHVDRCS